VNANAAPASTLRAALPVGVMVSAAVTMAAASGVLPAGWVFLFKPLTTVLILVFAWNRGVAVPQQRRLILIGLVLSLLGDVFLMWPTQGFLPGLVAFLLAHLAYIAAFCVPVRLASRWLPFVAYAAIAGAMLAFLWPGIPAGLQAPVVAYVACLASMAAQAVVWWRSRVGSSDAGHARYAAIGGLLFIVSDGLLATNKFSLPLPLSAVWILSSYWLAQWCIARSLPARTGQPTQPG